MRRLSRRLGVGAPAVSPEALELLQKFSFPGNVRELENVLERALALCNEGTIDVGDLQLRATPRNDGDFPGAHGSRSDDARRMARFHTRFRRAA